MKLLQSGKAKYEVEQAMVLCQMSHFDAGLLYLYEKAKMFKQILNNFIATNNSTKVLQTCQKYGDEEPNLWVDALWYFSNTDDNDQTIQVLNGTTISGIIYVFIYCSFQWLMTFQRLKGSDYFSPL